MGVLCLHQVFDLLLLCTKCIPCAVALLLHTGVENECRMAEGVAVLLTQHQRVVVERQDQGGVVVDPVQCLLARADLPVFRVCGIYPGGEGIQKGRKRLAEICVKRAVQMHVLCVLDRRTANARVPVVYGAALSADCGKIAAGDAARVPALHIPGAGAEEPCALGVRGPEVIHDELVVQGPIVSRRAGAR